MSEIIKRYLKTKKRAINAQANTLQQKNNDNNKFEKKKIIENLTENQYHKCMFCILYINIILVSFFSFLLSFKFCKPPFE